MRFDVFTLFPEMFVGPLQESILRRAVDRGLIEIGIHNIRDWTTDKHRSVDDRPYGGGPGMVIMAPPVVESVEDILAADLQSTTALVMSAAGLRFSQAMAQDLATHPRLALICGHYEGIDQRAIDILDATEVSIGDYVLTGGEIPAMVIIDTVARLVPGVIAAESAEAESHVTDLVEHPHYTRPPTYRGQEVPDVLLSGHHARVAAWRATQSARRTRLRDQAQTDTDAPLKTTGDVQESLRSTSARPERSNDADPSTAAE